MWCALFGAIVAIALGRFHRMIDSANVLLLAVDGLVIGLYLVWMIIELRITQKDVITEGKILFQIEGYTEYAKKRKRLVPALW